MVAATGRLVLFGIRPAEPHTGYGYIRQGAALDGFNGAAFQVDAFFEKPEKSVAETYVAAGHYYWNSGIFVLHAKTFIEEMSRLAPRVLEAARAALADAELDLGFLRLDKAALSQSPNTSIDYAIMEQTAQAAMIPLDIGWSDVGSWSSLWEMAPQDDKGNFIRGEALLEDTEGCYVHSERSLVSTIGVDNSGYRRHTRCAACRRQVTLARRQQGCAASAPFEPQGTGTTPAKLPSVGLL